MTINPPWAYQQIASGGKGGFWGWFVFLFFCCFCCFFYAVGIDPNILMTLCTVLLHVKFYCISICLGYCLCECCWWLRWSLISILVQGQSTQLLPRYNEIRMVHLVLIGQWWLWSYVNGFRAVSRLVKGEGHKGPRLCILWQCAYI